MGYKYNIDHFNIIPLEKRKKSCYFCSRNPEDTKIYVEIPVKGLFRKRKKIEVCVYCLNEYFNLPLNIDCYVD